MSLPHVLLALLGRGPASGWDLGTRLAKDRALGWDADLAQVYPALRRLLRGGFVALRRRRSSKGPPRREYRLTAAGRRELREWLAEPLSLPKPHAASLVRLAFLERRLPEARLASLHLYRDLLADELERAAAGTTAARRRRLLLLEAELAWADAEAAAILAGRTLSKETR
ncbi:MAG TPA: PadR family transcriptional regulator [Thermoanaerobaculia bacterium]|nr:PadR family transcriptional regulator [Thermoanaerobaculia bacterium]